MNALLALLPLWLTVMIFSAPTPFTEALQSREVRSILPTDLGSAELRKISADILERAVFSARVTNAEYLERIDQLTRQYVNGEIDTATFRTQLKVKLRELGYEPDIADRGKIADFGSERRLKVVVETNARIAQGYGQFIQGQNPFSLFAFPAQELFRLEAKKKERFWIGRWQEVGGKLSSDSVESIRDLRMIARKDDDIWRRLGTAFPDSLGNPYPPFAFGSGMWVKDVSRKEALKLGIIEPDTKIEPQTRGFNDDLRWSAEIRSEALRQALEDEGYQFDGDILTLGGDLG